MPTEGVKAFPFRFVALAETDQVRSNHAVPGLQKNRNHFAVEIAPGRVAVQAQKDHVCRRRFAGRFVQVVHAKSAKRRQIADVLRLPGVVGQILESGIGRSQGVIPQWMVLLGLVFLVGPPPAEKVLQQQAALSRHHTALKDRLVVQGRLRK